ncbi:membrane protein [Sphaerisporangium krabiense]|uniref:Regulator of protease activity HflC (Stomatin/prohibitin superfamily) n=1 Tax=Sphaerisporangium krabiense TaxID=763782 RepID=A0A7W9DTV0_9ACTN|nr:SPFH domain-containing protein [Sphaerisporangium krabiense]MBB5630459.1 regulator of protease activity HflC (stomatin/prohibitin superfamily) [Sphaerisporangium krabiense]GII62589.1 membrane protein [Sphaerisporangium krabiense]
MTQQTPGTVADVNEIEEVAVEMPAARVRERRPFDLNGWPMLGLGLLMLAGGVAVIVQGSEGDGSPALLVTGVALVILAALVLGSLMAVAPGEARVVQLLGRYLGTVRTDGLRWVIPFTQKRKISTRIRNHETDVAKVNDLDGNPIEMAAVVVWQVEDTAKATFEVDDFVEFVAIQTETAVRHIAGNYPYDAHDDTQLSLRDNADEITAKLSAEISARVSSAGVRVIESRITRLSYAPEIAQAMLRRQQAGAVVAARQRIVEGAVGMVEAALQRLDAADVVDLDDERKATMVSNLLVVLCGDKDVQPVVNTGSLYQ